MFKNQELTPSFVRTLVPFVVGPLVAYLASKGIDIDSVWLAMVVSSVVGYVYYVVARFLEVGLSPKWGYVLGFAKTPVYTEVPAVVSDAEGTRVVEDPSADETDYEVDIDPDGPVELGPEH